MKISCDIINKARQKRVTLYTNCYHFSQGLKSENFLTSVVIRK